MANPKIDDNFNPLLTAVSSTDETTPVGLVADPITGELLVRQNDVPPTAGNNPSTVVTETIDGTETTTVLEQTIGTTTYTQTIVEDTSTGVTTISEWV